MKMITYETANDMYVDLIPQIVESQQVKSADDKVSKNEEYKDTIIELTNVLYSIEDSSQVLTSIDAISQTPFWTISESLSEILNLNPPVMDKYSPQMMEQSYRLGDHRMPIYSYGSRWYESNGLCHIFQKLKNNPTSKRCYLPIYSGADLEPNRPDVPCTLGHQFTIRDNKLNVLGVYRSKDVMAGARYDPLLAQFLQWTMIGWLNSTGMNLEAGRLSFYDMSLHYYPHKDGERYEKFKVEIKDAQEKIYQDGSDVNLCWEPKQYYADLRKVLEIEQLTYFARGKSITAKLMGELDKIKYPLFKDFAICYMLKNKNLSFERVVNVIHHPWIRNWYSIFYKK